MYSPQRGSKLRTPERDNAAPSPLRALSPFVDAIKSAQSKANRDFESFYGNLMSRLTPKTSAVIKNVFLLLRILKILSLFFNVEPHL